MSKRGNYGQWTQDHLQMAVAAYRNGDYGLNECTRVYGIPKATIRRHAMEKNLYANNTKALGRTATFSVEMEKVLADHILMLEECFFGLTIKDVRQLAFDLAENLKLTHTFNTEKKLAGKKWFYSFLRRNPNLTVRQPECTSLARAKGFNKDNVSQFFDLLESSITKYGLTPDRIFNVDESGFNTVQKRPQKIVAQKGKHQVGVVASGERGVNTTVVCAVSAAGIYIPPMIIFKAKKMNHAFEVGAPPGSIVKISDTGYINSDLFLTWLEHFKNNIACTKERKILLLLDGHTTHSKNLAALNFALQNGIILLQLPGHTTHRLQPLDVAVFGPFQKYFIQAQEKFLNTYKGHPIRQTDLPRLLNEAYGKAASVANAQSAFRSTGIWPTDRHIFQDHHFAPANILLEDDTNQPSTSGSAPATNNDNEQNISFKDVLEQISPPPRRSKDPWPSTQRRNRKPQTSVVLTSSPYRNSLENAKQKSKKIAAKKQLFDESSGNNDGETSSWFCFLCKNCYEEEMIQCLKCRKWVHVRCAKVSPRRKIYYCSKCTI